MAPCPCEDMNCPRRHVTHGETCRRPGWERVIESCVCTLHPARLKDVSISLTRVTWLAQGMTGTGQGRGVYPR